MLTVNGAVKVVRRWWHAPGIGSRTLADDVIDPALDTVSPGVRELACRLNNSAHSFQAAADNLARAALVTMCGEQLRQLVSAEGQRVLAAQQDGTLPTAFRATDCVVDPPADQPHTRLYVGCDGVMVPLITEAEKVRRRQHVRLQRQRSGKRCRPLPPRRKGADLAFKEFKTLVFYDEHGRHWHQVLSRQPRRQIGALLRREAQRLGFRYAHEKIANVDGAPWIREQLLERPDQLPLDGLGLDFYHLSENVHRCRRRVFGEDDAAGQTWANDLLHTLRHAGFAAAWEQLLSWRSGVRGARAKSAADKLLNYISVRQEMIRYPEFTGRGWQIGSGPTESRCKTSTSRLKGRGRRWDARTAEQVASLTTLEGSGQWEHYWATHRAATS